LGAGSGIIGILLAKKYPNAEVVLIELQKVLFHLKIPPHPPLLKGEYWKFPSLEKRG
jgi:hypothetical protein